MSWKKKMNTPEATSAQMLAEASRIEQTKMRELRKLLNSAQRFGNEFRQKSAHYYEARQYAPAKTFLTLAKKLDQTQANTHVLMTVPKIREILTGLTSTIGPMTDAEGFNMNEIQERVTEIFSDDLINFESSSSVNVTEADMKELAKNYSMAMNRNEMEAFKRMDEALNE